VQINIIIIIIIIFLVSSALLFYLNEDMANKCHKLFLELAFRPIFAVVLSDDDRVLFEANSPVVV
jgi:hypothetical protein